MYTHTFQCYWFFVHLASTGKQHRPHEDFNTSSPPVQASMPKHHLGVPRAPSPRPSSHNTKHLPAGSTTSTKQLLLNGGENSSIASTTTTITQPSSISSGPTTNYASSTRNHATAWRTSTTENAIVPVITSLSQSHKTNSKPTFVNELNAPIYNDAECNFARGKNERNPKSLVIKKEILPTKAKFSMPTQQTSSSNPIKAVHPSMISGTSIYDSTIKPAQKPPTNTSVLDRRPSTPPPHRSPSIPTTTTRPSTPPPSRMFNCKIAFHYKVHNLKHYVCAIMYISRGGTT